MTRAFCARSLSALCVAACVAVAQASVLNEWNLIVAGNVNTTSEVDGSVMIGGNLTGTSNYSVQGVTASNGDGLAIGGDITGTINVSINNGGNLRIGGAITGGANVNLNGGGVQINDASTLSMVGSAFTEVESISSSLATLSANGSLDGAGNLNATPTLMGSDLVAVYNLANADFIGLSDLNLNFGAADTVIINVFADSGGVVDLIAPPNIIGGFSQANSSRILWNLPNATSVLINNSFNGALIAPYADLELQGGGMNGSVAVGSISVMNAEIRQFTYNGYIPEPSTLLLLGLGGVLCIRRRAA